MQDWVLRTCFELKKLMFSSMGTFFVYIEIIPELKNVIMGELIENSKKITSIIQINTFIKICSINSFESWLLVIRLVSWKMCFVSFNPPRVTPASTSWSPALAGYHPILQNFEEINSFQCFFWRSCYYYQISKKRPHCDSLSLFLLMLPPSLVPNAIF